MYDECVEKCSLHGFKQYEISNFAKSGRECFHNQCYWNAEEYAGYGPGAVGSLESQKGRIRYTNLKHPDGYCAAVETGKQLFFESEILDEQTLRVEKIMLGLRMNAGLPTIGLNLSDSAPKSRLS